MEGKVVVFLRTSSVARAPVYQHLKSLGLVLVLVHPNKPLKEFDGIFDHILVADTDSAVQLEPTLRKFLAEKGLTASAVISFDEYAVFTSTVLAKWMQLRPLPLPPSAIQEHNSKSKFRSLCQSNGIHSPQSVVLHLPGWIKDCIVRCGEGALEALQQQMGSIKEAIEPQVRSLSLPVVLKPSPGAGSLLAKLCTSLEEVAAHAVLMWHTFYHYPDSRHLCAINRIRCPPEDEPSDPHRTNGDTPHPTAEEVPFASQSPDVVLSEQYGMVVLVEEFIEGHEVDMDCVVEDGVLRFCSISDNFDTYPPYFVEQGGLCPTALPVEAQVALVELLRQYLAVYSHDLHGVLHFEAKYDERRKKAFVIEVNCRMGSAETNTMIRTCYRGLQLGECFVRCALGMSVKEQLQRHFTDGPSPSVPFTELKEAFYPSDGYAASVNLYPLRSGVLRQVQVPTELPYLVDYSVSAVAGDRVAPPPERFYLLCWMVCKGETVEEAKSRIDNAVHLFEQEIDA